MEQVYLEFYDGPHATPKAADSGPVYLGIKNITDDGRLDLSEVTYISEQDYPKWTKRVTPRAGDIVFTYEATLNRYAVIPEGLRCCLGRRLALIRPNPQRVDTRFLHYSFFGAAWRKVIESRRIAGATVDRIPLVTFPHFEIALPPLETQRKIAAVLSAYDDLMENNNRRIAILEEMVRLLYREWFVHFRFPGHETVRMVESALGLIPEGWETKSIADLLEYHIGGGWGAEIEGDKHTETAYVIRGTDIPNAMHLDLRNLPHRFHLSSNLRSRRLKAYDIIFEVSGGSKEQPVGRALLVTQVLLDALDGNVMCASFCKLLRARRESILAELLYLHILEIYNDRQIMKYQVQSTGITNLKFEFFLAQEQIAVPPFIYQERFSVIITPIIQLIQNLGARNGDLRSTRDMLLPKLIAGELSLQDIQGLEVSGITVQIS